MAFMNNQSGIHPMLIPLGFRNAAVASTNSPLSTTRTRGFQLTDNEIIQLAKKHYPQYFTLFPINDDDLKSLYDFNIYKESIKKPENFYLNVIVHLSIETLLRSDYTYGLHCLLIAIEKCSTTESNINKLNAIELLYALTNQFLSNKKKNGYYYIAKKYFDKLITKNSSKIHYFKGKFHYYYNEKDLAIEIFKKGIELKCIKCLYQLTGLYKDLNKQNRNEVYCTEIIDLYKKAYYEFTDTEALVHLANYYKYDLENIELAKETYEKCIAEEIKTSHVYEQLSNCEAMLGNNDNYYTILYEGVFDSNFDEDTSFIFDRMNKFVLINVLKDLVAKNRIQIREKICDKFNGILSEAEIADIFHPQIFKPFVIPETATTASDDEPESKKEKKEYECCICYESSDLRQTKCEHIICGGCSKKLISYDCPMCRQQLFDRTYGEVE